MDADEKWIASLDGVLTETDMRAAIARGREQGRAEGKAERDQLLAWRSDVTVALGRPQGTFYADVPKLIRDALDRLAELEAREKGARWLLATAHITKSLTPPEWHSKREAWLAGGHAAPIPDPARGLIERAARWFEAHRTGDFTPEYAATIERDLRAYLGGG